MTAIPHQRITSLKEQRQALQQRARTIRAATGTPYSSEVHLLARAELPRPRQLAGNHRLQRGTRRSTQGTICAPIQAPPGTSRSRNQAVRTGKHSAEFPWS